jgi:hypothetical protein
MNTLVKLALMAKANGRTVKEEMVAIINSAFDVHSKKIDHRPELASMQTSAPVGAVVPSNPTLAFSHVVTEEAPDPTVVIARPTRRAEPVSINRPRPSGRRPHKHDRHS